MVAGIYIAQVAGGDGDVLVHRDPVVGDQAVVGAIGVLVLADDFDVFGIDQHRTAPAIGGAGPQGAALEPHRARCREFDVAAIARDFAAACRDLGAGCEAGGIASEDSHIAAVRARAVAIGRHASTVGEGDVLACVDADPACRRTVAAVGCEPAGHRHVLAADDAYRVAFGEHRRRAVEAVDIDHCAKLDARRGAGRDVGIRSDPHACGGKVHRPRGADAALDRDQPGFRERYAAFERGRDGGVFDIARAVDQPVHEAGARRGQQQAADVDLSAGADRDAVWVEEEHVAADAPVLVGVHHAVEGAALVAHQVEQVGGAAGQVQIDGLAAADVEAAE